jgi:EpsI family protein
MTTKRLLLLQVILLTGLGGVFLLPKVSETQPLGIHLDLPEYVGEWLGEDQTVSKREQEVLGPETQFARKVYTNGLGDELFVSIVLAGSDMNTSIHRPERCLPAQGWTIAKSGRVMAPVKGETPEAISTTRLYNVRPLKNEQNEEIAVHGLNYYWFVGNGVTTSSHFERTWIDIKDRLLKGYNQRWAYVTVAATITKDLKRFGRSEKETDQVIQQFIASLVPLIHKD